MRQISGIPLKFTQIRIVAEIFVRSSKPIFSTRCSECQGSSHRFPYTSIEIPIRTVTGQVGSRKEAETGVEGGGARIRNTRVFLA